MTGRHRIPDALLRQALRERAAGTAVGLDGEILARVDSMPQRRSWSPALVLADAHTFAGLAIAIAAVVMVAVMGMNLFQGRSGDGHGGPTFSPSPSATSPPDLSPRPSASAPPEVRPGSADFSIGRHSVVVDGLRFSFDVPAHNWEPFSTDENRMGPAWDPSGTVSINKSDFGSQGAEAIIYWTGFPDGASTALCPGLLTLRRPASVDEVAAAVSRAPGTDLQAGPVDVTVGGRPAKHVVLTVREDVGCDPGYFHSWDDVPWGALWPATSPGDVIRVWIVDVDEGPLFIAAVTVGPEVLERQILQILESIRFE